ncbi:MAG: type II CRISPR RNA-guided endonuclease Cas9 [Burkholderiales bacterium]|nr:type II CRISPR RNA-guided endonuclease Cas9 [Burkholderiales bacterium]
MRYRLALDLGSTSLGFALLRLDDKSNPYAIIKAGVRIFSNGRDPDGNSLAVTRRMARAMRRRRDRLLRRKARMMQLLIAHGFFPQDPAARKALEELNPYELRAQGLDEPLTPEEFARAIFHLNQRRGFQSNRKTDKKDNDSGALKNAIKRLRDALTEGHARTVGELLFKRMQSGQTVRARYRENKSLKPDGKAKIDKSYDLYIDRAMVIDEFEALWRKQACLNPDVFTDAAYLDLKDCLTKQRPLRPVRPGRCTFLPDEERAPLALPSTQRYRIYLEANHLRFLREGLQEEVLTLAQRDALVQALENNPKRTFAQIKSLLGIKGAVQFNFEDPKRQELKGNTTSAILSKPAHFGQAWFTFDEARQDKIVSRIISEENESTLIDWLVRETGVDEARAEAIANVGLPEGYGGLSRKALARIIPALRQDVITYDKAVQAAGFEHHSQLDAASTGEQHPALPYYGEALQRHVSFGTGNPNDPDEKRYGKIANPTVHIGLNQVRTVVNALIKRYGHPSQVVIEVARDLKQSRLQREETNKRQAENQKRNARIRQAIAEASNGAISPERVKVADIQKWILWEELNPLDVLNRCCPYSGARITAQDLLSSDGRVEIEHILPYARTLDDSLNNKTVSMRWANRYKGNQTPAEAFSENQVEGCNYEDILKRAEQMPKGKRYRFAPDAMERWDKEDAGFLARALNDTRYLSRITREYISLICPQATWVIPGRMTALLRHQFGLNSILGLQGEKNRNDHRHHAVDACVIGVTDRKTLQDLSNASKRGRDQHVMDWADNMGDPWLNYREHVRRAVNHILVSHKPDHSHEGAMHNDTAYSLLGNGRVGVHKLVDGKRTLIEDTLKVIEFSYAKAKHATNEPWFESDHNHRAGAYKGYKGDSNYCIEIVRNDKGKWEGEVISTFEAYQLVRAEKKAGRDGTARVRHPTESISGKPLVMRLIRDDYVRLETEEGIKLMRLAKMVGDGRMYLVEHNEANESARARDKEDPFSYTVKTPVGLQKAKGRRVTVSPIGELRDPGFKE